MSKPTNTIYSKDFAILKLKTLEKENKKLKNIIKEVIEEEKKIPKKLKCKYTSQIGKIELAKTINEIIDYL